MPTEKPRRESSSAMTRPIRLAAPVTRTFMPKCGNPQSLAVCRRCLPKCARRKRRRLQTARAGNKYRFFSALHWRCARISTPLREARIGDPGPSASGKDYQGLSFGTTPQPLLPLVASGKTLKSCPDTCLSVDAKSNDNQMCSADRVEPTLPQKRREDGAPTLVTF